MVERPSQTLQSGAWAVLLCVLLQTAAGCTFYILFRMYVRIQQPPHKKEAAVSEAVSKK